MLILRQISSFIRSITLKIDQKTANIQKNLSPNKKAYSLTNFIDLSDINLTHYRLINEIFQGFNYDI